MITTSIVKKITLLSSAILMTVFTFAQGNPPKSPADSVTGNIKGATVTIRYSSPSVKEREIWGKLVPYGKIWRAGANTSTSFETSKELKVEGQTLPAGKYSLYVLVEENSWTYIFNSQTGQWGITRAGETTNDPAKDVIKVKVKAVKSASFNERLVYVIDSKGFSLRWENKEAPVSVK